MSANGKFWNNVKKVSKAHNQSPVQVGIVNKLDPLTISFGGYEISKANGDTIYLNNLILDAKETFDTANAITCSSGSITENHTGIINQITSFISDLQTRYIIEVGDYVAIQKLGNNTYIILSKVIND